MMRSVESESRWENHTIIGYVPLDTNGKPYRAARSGYRNKPDNGYHPPRVYQTIEKAVSQSPCRTAAEVRMFTPIYVDPKGVTDYN